MLRKVGSVICYVVAGFFIYMVCLIAFVKESPFLMKLAIMAGFSVPAWIALTIGLVFSRAHKWRRDIGIVFISATAFTCFLAFTLVCLLLSPESREFFPEDQRDFFSDYATGVTCLLTFAIAGLFLLKSSKRPASGPTLADPITSKP